MAPLAPASSPNHPIQGIQLLFLKPGLLCAPYKHRLLQEPKCPHPCFLWAFKILHFLHVTCSLSPCLTFKLSYTNKWVCESPSLGSELPFGKLGLLVSTESPARCTAPSRVPPGSRIRILIGSCGFSRPPT